MSLRRRQTKTRISRRREISENASPQFAAPPVIKPKIQRKIERELPEWKPGGNSKSSPLQRLQPSATLQAQLEIGQPNDPYEQQANTVAHNVVKQINSPVSNDAQQHPTVQRQTQEGIIQKDGQEWSDVSWGSRQRLKKAELMQSRFRAAVNKLISDGVLENTWLGLSDDVKPGSVHKDEIKKMKPEARKLLQESSEQVCLLINTTRNSLERIVERYKQLIPALEYNQTKSRMADWKNTKEHEQSIAKHEGRIRECVAKAKTLGVAIGDMSDFLK